MQRMSKVEVRKMLESRLKDIRAMANKGLSIAQCSRELKLPYDNSLRTWINMFHPELKDKFAANGEIRKSFGYNRRGIA